MWDNACTHVNKKYDHMSRYKSTECTDILLSRAMKKPKYTQLRWSIQCIKYLALCTFYCYSGVSVSIRQWPSTASNVWLLERVTWMKASQPKRNNFVPLCSSCFALSSMVAAGSSITFASPEQGTKLGWSCGPSLPELLVDHQIMLCGGPVVYWKLLTINFDNILKMCTDTFYDQCHIFSIQFIYCKVFSNVLHGSRHILSAVFDFIKTIVQLARSGPPEIKQDHPIYRASGPMVHCL